MILVDFSHTMSSVIMSELGKDSENMDPDLIQHIILNTIRKFNMKFRKEYGEMILCTEGSKCWRYDIFPMYKARRKKNRAKSDFDWEFVYKTMNTVVSDIVMNGPFKVLKHDRCEADDIIATLAINSDEPVLIVSRDKDFRQLLVHDHIKLYAPIDEKFVEESNPAGYLSMQIIKGDSGDDVPNVLSDDDTFIDDDKRQPPMTGKRINALSDPEGRAELQKQFPKLNKNIARNMKLINLEKTPDDIKQEIIELNENTPAKPLRKFMNYLIRKDMDTLLESIGDFDGV